MPEQIFTPFGLVAFIVFIIGSVILVYTKGTAKTNEQQKRVDELTAETNKLKQDFEGRIKLIRTETERDAAQATQTIMSSLTGLLQTAMQQHQNELNNIRKEHGIYAAETEQRLEEEMTKRELLEKQVKELTERLEETERQLHLKEEENKRLQTENSTLHSDNESLKKQIENLKFELDQVRKELNLVQERLGQGDFKLDGRQTNS